MEVEQLEKIVALQLDLKQLKKTDRYSYDNILARFTYPLTYFQSDELDSRKIIDIHMIIFIETMNFTRGLIIGNRDHMLIVDYLQRVWYQFEDDILKIRYVEQDRWIEFSDRFAKTIKKTIWSVYKDDMRKNPRDQLMALDPITGKVKQFFLDEYDERKEDKHDAQYPDNYNEIIDVDDDDDYDDYDEDDDENEDE